MEGIELVRGIEVFVVFAVAALDLAVMAGRVDLNELVPDTQLVKRSLKERRAIGFGAGHLGGKLRAVVRLYALDHVGELLYAMPDELSGGVGVVVLEGLQVTEATIFINEGDTASSTAALACAPL